MRAALKVCNSSQNQSWELYLLVLTAFCSTWQIILPPRIRKFTIGFLWGIGRMGDTVLGRHLAQKHTWVFPEGRVLVQHLSNQSSCFSSLKLKFISSEVVSYMNKIIKNCYFKNHILNSKNLTFLLRVSFSRKKKICCKGHCSNTSINICGGKNRLE